MEKISRSRRTPFKNAVNNPNVKIITGKLPLRDALSTEYVVQVIKRGSQFMFYIVVHRQKATAFSRSVWFHFTVNNISLEGLSSDEPEPQLLQTTDESNHPIDRGFTG